MKFSQRGDGKIIYKVLISEQAQVDMQSHIAFLARVSEQAAKKIFDKLLEKIGSLNFMPNRGQVIKTFNKNRKKLVIDKKFIILYSIFKNKIYIENVINSRMKVD